MTAARDQVLKPEPVKVSAAWQLTTPDGRMCVASTPAAPVA
jgi:hypothetical protein